MNKHEFWEESGELPGILNRVIAAVKRLNDNKGFTKSASSEMLHSEYRQNSDSVQLFMHDDGYKPDTVERILLSNLYTPYQDYCRANGYSAVSQQTMAERLRNVGYTVTRGSRNKTVVLAIKTELCGWSDATHEAVRRRNNGQSNPHSNDGDDE
jgi:phage/plasmid-associated DNA primase